MTSSEPTVHQIASWAMIVTGLFTAAALRFLSAPYGRHARSGWGPTLPARTGWILMEAPASLGFLAIYLAGDRRFEVGSLALLALWQAHYVHRAFIYPFRMRAAGKTMPASIVGMAVAFNGWNAYINARWISHLGDYPASWLTGPRFIAGALLFFAGMAVNVWADTVLLRLRRPGEKGYRVPRGGLFELVACPNYLGEIVEWAGFAVAAWSLPGLAFAIYTAANIGPRAASHLAWYRAELPDYPRDRKALIPYLW